MLALAAKVPIVAPMQEKFTSPNSSPDPKDALSGVKVLDLSRVLAGPWASQFLGDLGAEVIKIERPGLGDDTRRWGPPFFERDGAAANDRHDAAYFLCANRNKKSVAINIADPRGADIIRRLAADCDILLENFKVGGLSKYGLDFPSVSKINPRLVYCSITGFGQSGPHRDKAGYDYMIQAMGGLMSITGQPAGTPGDEPMKVGVAVADIFTGMYAVGSILAALRHAERTGQGQHLDVALFDCQAAMLANQASNYFVSGTPPQRMGNAHPNIAPYQVVPVADGYIVIAVGNDGQFAKFCDALARSDLTTDQRFQSNSSRVQNRKALNAEIIPVLVTRDGADWLDMFEQAGVPAGPINDLKQVFNDPQSEARQLTTKCSPTLPKIAAHPVKYTQTPARTPSFPPALGDATLSVLKDYLSEEEFHQLASDGVID